MSSRTAAGGPARAAVSVADVWGTSRGTGWQAAVPRAWAAAPPLVVASSSPPPPPPPRAFVDTDVDAPWTPPPSAFGAAAPLRQRHAGVMRLVTPHAGAAAAAPADFDNDDDDDDTPPPPRRHRAQRRHPPTAACGCGCTCTRGAAAASCGYDAADYGIFAAIAVAILVMVVCAVACVSSVRSALRQHEMLMAFVVAAVTRPPPLPQFASYGGSSGSGGFWVPNPSAPLPAAGAAATALR